MSKQLSRQESVQTQASAAEPGSKDAQPDALQDADSSLSTVDLGAVSISQAAVSAEQLPFPTWERYKILSLLGSGGMGAVYKARDLRLNRYIAIKFLRGSQADALDQRQRRHFEREARAQARIEHPNICKIYEVGEVEGQPYIAMQLIHGSSLCDPRQMMTREDKVRAIQKIAEALHVAHSQNLIHRDIKPGNIMVEHRPDGTFWPYLMDFGLAREVDSGSLQTTTGTVEGTPAFMAPEQARGDMRSLDARTDIYGLGATLYSALCSRPPFVGTSTEVLLSVLQEEPLWLRALDPAIPRALAIIVQKCLEKDPKRRYESAKALADDLERFLDGTRIAARPPGLLRRAGKFAQRHKLLVASIATAAVVGLALGGLALRIRAQAAEQARLAERLGQEIKDMEWLLRSARLLSVHDLDREKSIARRRMRELQLELASYGALSRGLAHYALGRGHITLHEYPEALVHLQQAVKFGVNSAELYYALGIVLGKHFEQAMYEARLSGGGDWAKKQLKELEPRYLIPAIEAFKRSRGTRRDAPQYLEALIAYYQRDYDAALKQADAALAEAPWLYEAAKLAGDVHLERALQARDSGRYEDAEREFASAVKRYVAAAVQGRSDGAVYEGLAEAWIRQEEMARIRGKSIEEAYTAAVAASDKIMAVEPQSISGPLKKAFAVVMAAALGAGQASKDRVRLCLESVKIVLEKQPRHPYASEVAALCNEVAAEIAQAAGEDPEPFLRKATALLEQVIKEHPRFLWGLNDLGINYQILGQFFQLHGKPSAKEMFQKALDGFAAAALLDPTYIEAPSNALVPLGSLVAEARSQEEIQALLSRSDSWSLKCQAINRQYVYCFSNLFQLYARAASRMLLAGQDPGPTIKVGLQNLAETRRLGGNSLDVEQYAALLHLAAAMDSARHGKDPAGMLAEQQQDLARCFALAPRDAMCRTLAAQAEWRQADWLTSQKRPAAASLQAALAKAELATKSPEKFPDSWQTLAESHLRLARAEQSPSTTRTIHLAAGLAAAEKVLAINPNHALGLATKGQLALLQAQIAGEAPERQKVAQGAQQALEMALRNEPFLSQAYAPSLEAARGLAQSLSSCAPSRGTTSTCL